MQYSVRVQAESNRDPHVTSRCGAKACKFQLTQRKIFGEHSRFTLSDTDTNDLLAVLDGNELTAAFTGDRRVAVNENVAVAAHRFNTEAERRNINQQRDANPIMLLRK